MKTISKEKTISIKALLLQGQSTRQVASRLGVGIATVSRVRQSIQENIPPSTIGRPKLLNAQTRRFLVRKITSGEIDNAVQGQDLLRNKLNLDVNTQTVRNALQEEGLQAVVKTKKPRITKENMRKRLAFAEEHVKWTINDWKTVVFSDETKINRCGSDGRIWGYKKAKSKSKVLDPRLLKPTIQGHGGHMMIWGCMSWAGVGDACHVEGRMNSNFYINDILDKYVVPSRDWLGIDPQDFEFQQDNASIHNAQKVDKWFKDNNIKKMEWPPQSPDLNPMEHLWNYCKRELNKYEEHPKSMKELWQRFEDIWANISHDTCKDLVESMQNRCQAVIDTKGGPTKY